MIKNKEVIILSLFLSVIFWILSNFAVVIHIPCNNSSFYFLGFKITGNEYVIPKGAGGFSCDGETDIIGFPIGTKIDIGFGMINFNLSMVISIVINLLFYFSFIYIVHMFYNFKKYNLVAINIIIFLIIGLIIYFLQNYEFLNM